MAVAVLLLEADPGEIHVSPMTAPQLGRLGVTHIRVVGDEHGYGLIVEGWAFDPAVIDQVGELLGHAIRRLLRPVMEVAISDVIEGRSFDPSHLDELRATAPASSAPGRSAAGGTR